MFSYTGYPSTRSLFLSGYRSTRSLLLPGYSHSRSQLLPGQQVIEPAIAHDWLLIGIYIPDWCTKYPLPMLVIVLDCGSDKVVKNSKETLNGFWKKLLGNIARILRKLHAKSSMYVLCMFSLLLPGYLRLSHYSYLCTSVPSYYTYLLLGDTRSSHPYLSGRARSHVICSTCYRVYLLNSSQAPPGNYLHGYSTLVGTYPIDTHSHFGTYYEWGRRVVCGMGYLSRT